MVQVRYQLFETNSSSVHVLTIPKTQNICVPKRFIYMGDETSSRPTEVTLCNLFSDWHGNAREYIEQIINFLYLNGVEEIIYGGRGNELITNAIEEYKDNPVDMGLPKNWTKDLLLRTLFGDETECDYYSASEEYFYDKDEIENDYVVFRG